jgi:hypothetical protein
MKRLRFIGSVMTGLGLLFASVIMMTGALNQGSIGSDIIFAVFLFVAAAGQFVAAVDS